jgi:hypothetical protein
VSYRAMMHGNSEKSHNYMQIEKIMGKHKSPAYNGTALGMIADHCKIYYPHTLNDDGEFVDITKSFLSIKGPDGISVPLPNVFDWPVFQRTQKVHNEDNPFYKYSRSLDTIEKCLINLHSAAYQNNINKYITFIYENEKELNFQYDLGKSVITKKHFLSMIFNSIDGKDVYNKIGSFNKNFINGFFSNTEYTLSSICNPIYSYFYFRMHDFAHRDNDMYSNRFSNLKYTDIYKWRFGTIDNTIDNVLSITKNIKEDGVIISKTDIDSLFNIINMSIIFDIKKKLLENNNYFKKAMAKAMVVPEFRELIIKYNNKTINLINKMMNNFSYNKKGNIYSVFENREYRIKNHYSLLNDLQELTDCIYRCCVNMHEYYTGYNIQKNSSLFSYSALLYTQITSFITMIESKPQ